MGVSGHSLQNKFCSRETPVMLTEIKHCLTDLIKSRKPILSFLLGTVEFESGCTRLNADTWFCWCLLSGTAVLLLCTSARRFKQHISLLTLGKKMLCLPLFALSSPFENVEKLKTPKQFSVLSLWSRLFISICRVPIQRQVVVTARRSRDTLPALLSRGMEHRRPSLATLPAHPSLATLPAHPNLDTLPVHRSLAILPVRPNQGTGPHLHNQGMALLQRNQDTAHPRHSPATTRQVLRKVVRATEPRHTEQVLDPRLLRPATCTLACPDRTTRPQRRCSTCPFTEDLLLPVKNEW